MWNVEFQLEHVRRYREEKISGGQFDCQGIHHLVAAATAPLLEVLVFSRAAHPVGLAQQLKANNSNVAAAAIPFEILERRRCSAIHAEKIRRLICLSD